MPGPASPSRLTQLLVGLPLLCACAAGSDDGLTGFSSTAYTVGPVGDGGDEEDTEGDSDGSGNGSAEGPITTAGSADGTSTGGGGDDGGNPMCCEPGGQAGCGSEATEGCVCAGLPSCCTMVWTSDCVDLAIACGDPFCADDPTDSGDPPPECPDFTFMPEPTAGASFTVTFSDPVGLVYVGMYADGPGGASVQGGNEVIRGSMGSFSWSYDYDGLAAGPWTFRFVHRESMDGPELVRGTCQRML